MNRALNRKSQVTNCSDHLPLKSVATRISLGYTRLKWPSNRPGIPLESPWNPAGHVVSSAQQGTELPGLGQLGRAVVVEADAEEQALQPQDPVHLAGLRSLHTSQILN